MSETKPLRAISLWQPWATLVAIGAKQVETRHWSAPKSVRGEMAIHAAKKWSRDLAAMCMEEPFRSTLLPLARAAWPDLHGDAAVGFEKTLDFYLRRYAGTPRGLPLGGYVARTLLNGCYRAEDMVPLISSTEAAFGDFSPGRFGWDLGPTIALPSIVRAKGRQGFWTVEGDAAARIRSAAPFPWEAR